MKLTHFSITNYRSITTAHKISLHSTTILIGKNNEGKSNILKALNVAMSCLKMHANDKDLFGMNKRRFYSRNTVDRFDIYDWCVDFPISLQDRERGLQTIFSLDFELTEQEIIDFKASTGSNINGLLPVEIRLGKDNRHTFKIKEKRGRGGKTLNKKSAKIASFIASNIDFNYIPAIRTNESTMDIVDAMLSNYLKELDSQAEYQQAIERISELQKPYLEELEEKLKIPLQEFLPNINNVKISVSDTFRRRALRNDIEIIIDDGTPTNLAYKGDGVKSLVALSLLKDKIPNFGASIIAIEEPESHLHSGAIHQLNDVIQALGLNHQVIITTHNQLFIDRDDIKSNIIVDNGKAMPCKNIQQIRDIMGIKASDNLVNARYVLVVEGEEDIIALKAILPKLSIELDRALREKSLIIESLGGASNLSYKLSSLKNCLCTYHCYLDNDDAGRTAVERAKSNNYLDESGYNLTTCRSFQNSEFEDCIIKEVYQNDLLEKFGIDINVTGFRGSDSVWSNRIKRVGVEQGKTWSDNLESQIKFTVAEAIKRNPESCLHEQKKQSLEALVRSLESMIIT